MSRSLSDLLAALDVRAACDVRLASIGGQAAAEGIAFADPHDARRTVAVSTLAAAILDEREAALLESAGALVLGGEQPFPVARPLEALWLEVERLARLHYGDRCRVRSSHDESGSWHASVLAPARRRGAANDHQVTYFHAHGDDERGVLLEIAAFVGNESSRTGG